jgi:hypothetical protein
VFDSDPELEVILPCSIMLGGLFLIVAGSFFIVHTYFKRADVEELGRNAIIAGNKAKLVKWISGIGVIVILVISFFVFNGINTFPEVMTHYEWFWIFRVCPTSLAILIILLLVSSYQLYIHKLKQRTDAVIIDYYNKTRKDYVFPVAMLFAGFLILFTPLVMLLLTSQFKYNVHVYSLICIPFFILAVFTWPQIPCSVLIHSDHIIFNEKSKTMLYNPKIQISYTEIENIFRQQEENELIFKLKSGQMKTLDISGADPNDVEMIINTLLERTSIKA